MKKHAFLLVILLGASALVRGQQDIEGGKDPALFNRMPNHHISDFTENQFDKYEFRISDGKTQVVEGHLLKVNYDINDNAPAVSGIQVVRNYTNAVKKIGGQIVYEWEDGGYQCSVMKVVKNNLEAWAYVESAGNGMYKVVVVEKQLMNQDVVADAASMAKTISETGKVAIYGIHFDFGKSTLKPESQSTLQQIKKLLDSDPSLKLYVVGHTDNVGDFDSNIKLSNERAGTVVNALTTQYGINQSRLKAWGDGATAPVATNGTEEGRALNRRVELVKQ
ncbi:MAG TPA: OmpA family protein [Bacteroidales bacterium]|nr:OmpA family protein [Bacteroidales bacterium]